MGRKPLSQKNAAVTPKDIELKPYQESLVRVFSRCNPKQIVEVGVYRGETSRVLLAFFTEAELSMVDPWRAVSYDRPYYHTGDHCARMSQEDHDRTYSEAIRNTEPWNRRCVVQRMSSTTAARMVKDKAIDAIFIDGDHSFDGVIADIAAWWPKLRNGGIMAGHDFQHPRDIRGLFGVQRAVEIFSEVSGVPYHVEPGTVWWMEKP